jgi:ACR3 family arsenite transporter
MSAQCEVTAKRSSGAQLGLFERYLTLWVGLCTVAGIGLGHLVPAAFQAIGGLQLAEVNLPVAVLIWLMIIPMLLKIDFKALHRVKEHWRGVGVTLFVNWAVKPFSMALLAWIFIRHVFAPYLPADQLDSYVAGLILLAAAPCTAMVFVWSNLSGGGPHFTLSQVALNDTIMIVAFAPLVGLLLGLSAITVPWDTLFLSVFLYIVLPVVFAHWWRGRLLRTGGEAGLKRVLDRLQPVSLIAQNTRRTVLRTRLRRCANAVLVYLSALVHPRRVFFQEACAGMRRLWQYILCMIYFTRRILSAGSHNQLRRQDNDCSYWYQWLRPHGASRSAYRLGPRRPGLHPYQRDRL